MKYSNVTPAKFISRPNRFIAVVDINGSEEAVHVKNTGRCRELLIKNCVVYLTKSDNAARKTKYDLIAVEKMCPDGRKMLINMDSQIPNDLVEEWLATTKPFGKSAVIKREYTYGNSRFDFYIESGNRKILLEVKGCTLEDNGIAKFPDAPTVRGVKHINELISGTKVGYETYIFFVAQMKGIEYFTPNYETHREFGDALRMAQKSGVKIMCYDCVVSPTELYIDSSVRVIL